MTVVDRPIVNETPIIETARIVGSSNKRLSIKPWF
jgi:hypothetical protein